MKLKREVHSDAEADSRESSNNSDNDSFEQVLARRLARRNFLKGAAVSTGLLVINSSAMAAMAATAEHDRDRSD
jgi:secreted PhoX family phosphatase